MTRICSMSISRPTNRANAALVQIIMADEPEMPAPAGDSECVSRRKPCFGSKNLTRYAASACLYRLAASSASRLAKRSSRPGIDRLEMYARGPCVE